MHSLAVLVVVVSFSRDERHPWIRLVIVDGPLSSTAKTNAAMVSDNIGTVRERDEYKVTWSSMNEERLVIR